MQLFRVRIMFAFLNACLNWSNHGNICFKDSLHNKKNEDIFIYFLLLMLLFYIDGQREINEGRVEKPLLTTNFMNLSTNH